VSWPRFFSLLVSSFVLSATARAFDISLPTANDALLRPGGDADYFQPTVDGTVESGMFGCVRSHGHRFHEGIDIKCVRRRKLANHSEACSNAANPSFSVSMKTNSRGVLATNL
jgi:hypothetical protein